MPRKMLSIPFGLPLPILRQMGKPLGTMGARMAKGNPLLSIQLNQAEITEVDDKEYTTLVLTNTIFWTVILAIVTIPIMSLVVSNRATALHATGFMIGGGITLVLAALIFFMGMSYPTALARKKIREIESNLIFALRTLLVQIKSGVSLFSGLDMGDNYAVTEALPGGWTLTNVTIDGAASALNVTKNVTIPDGTTRVVAFYNQPLGSLNVHKVAVTSHNAGPDVPAPNDDDGWTITVSSVACGINQSKQTDANGNASFTGLPLCTDYVVSENPVNAGSPGFNPVSPTSFSNQKPEGQTLTFTNRLATFDPPCQDCIQVTPTPTPTFTPTATPTTPPTSTPTTRPTEEATAGARTPGPTPIAPSTGTGGSGGAASMNLLLLSSDCS